MATQMRLLKITVAGIIGICLSALLSVGYLSWTEGLRLAVVLTGLLVFWVKSNGKIWPIEKKQPDNLEKLQITPVILSLGVMFVITQFDPTTSAFSLHETTNRLNFFFIFSTLMIFGVFFGLVLWQYESLKWRNLSFLDRWVLILGVGILAISVISKKWIGSHYGINDVLAQIKILSYLGLWFVIPRAFSPIKPDNFRYLFCAFACIFGLGIIALSYCVYQTGQVFYHSRAGAEAFTQQKKDVALEHYNSARKYNRIIDLGFARESYLSDLAILYFSREKSQEAREIILEIRQKTYDDGEAHRQIGDIYFRAEKWTEAGREYEAVVNIEGKNTAIIDRLGKIYLTHGNSKRFLDMVEKFQYFPKTDVQSFEEFIFLGNVQYHRDRFKESQIFYEKAVLLKPNDAYAIYKVGRAILAQRNHQDALPYFRNAIATDSHFADAYYRLGICLENLGQDEEAQRMYDQTVQILPNHLDGLLALKRILEKNNK